MPASLKDSVSFTQTEVRRKLKIYLPIPGTIVIVTPFFDRIACVYSLRKFESVVKAEAKIRKKTHFKHFHSTANGTFDLPNLIIIGNVFMAQ